MIDEKSKDLLSFFEAFIELYVINEDFVVEYMSASMIKRFGDGLGKKCHEVLHLSGEICPWCRAKDIFAGQSARWEPSNFWPCANLTVGCRIESSIRRTPLIIFAGCPCASNGILSILLTNSWRTSRQSKLRAGHLRVYDEVPEDRNVVRIGGEQIDI